MKNFAASCLFIALSVSCSAQIKPVLDIIRGGMAVVPLSDAVGGWQFHVSEAITITALGLWDEGGTPLNIPHPVGLWTLDRRLLATATVDNTGTPVASASADGRWLFTPISPISLPPGDYVLGAVWGDADMGADLFRGPSLAPVTSGVSFSGGRSRTLLPSPVLVFPDAWWGGNGIFGPNAATGVWPGQKTTFLETYDMAVPHQCDGLSLDGITYSFTVGGAPSIDCTAGTLAAIGNTNHVSPPYIDGSTVGELTLKFDAPTTRFAFGIALTAPVSMQPCFVIIDLYRPGAGLLRQELQLTTDMDFNLLGGRFDYDGQAVRNVTIRFDLNQSFRFAIDNVSYFRPSGQAKQ